MWQCYIHLWQYSCFVQKNSAYIFSSRKSNLMDEVVSSVWLMIKSQLTSRESLKILTSTSDQVVCLLGQGVLTFLQPPHSTSLLNITYHTFVDQYCVFAWKCAWLYICNLEYLILSENTRKYLITNLSQGKHH